MTFQDWRDTFCSILICYLIFQDVVEMLQVKRRAKESVASSRLGKRIDKMLKKIDTTLCDLEESVSHLPDGKIDMDEYVSYDTS